MSIIEIKEKVVKHFKVDAYGRVYLDALEQSESEYGEQGIKTQVLYILSNARAVGTEGKLVKKELLKYANS